MNATPSYLNRKLSPILQTLTGPACQHPIRTIVFILVLASSSYIGLLEGSLFDAANSARSSGHIDLASLVDGGRQLKLGHETSWKWQIDTRQVDEVEEVCYKLSSSLAIADQTGGKSSRARYFSLSKLTLS